MPRRERPHLPHMQDAGAEPQFQRNGATPRRIEQGHPQDSHAITVRAPSPQQGATKPDGFLQEVESGGVPTEEGLPHEPEKRQSKSTDAHDESELQ